MRPTPQRAGKPAARGRYAALQLIKAKAGKIARRFSRAAHDAAEPDVYADTGLYLSDTLQLLQFWQDNASHDCLDDSIYNKQDRTFPQP